jgi:hypothetical protein
VEYLHIINPRRRFRADVSPEERFPREPGTIEKDALSAHVTRAGRRRTADVPLDPDPDPDPDPEEDQELHGPSLTESTAVFCEGATYSPAFGIVWANWLALNRGTNKKGAAREWNTTLRSRLNGDKPEASAERIQRAAGNFAEAMRLEGRSPDVILHCATWLGRDQRWLEYENWVPTAARASPGLSPLPECYDPAIYERKVKGPKEGQE